MVTAYPMLTCLTVQNCELNGINMQVLLVPTLDRALTGTAVPLHLLVSWAREIVTQIPTVLEIWFVAKTTVVTSMQMPRVKLIAA